jgi:protease secretion system membrane fusion protein
MHNQEMLLAARRSGLAAELQGIEESIQGQEAQIQGLTGVLQSRKSQRDLINMQLSDIRELVKDGYAPRVQQQELELKLAQSMGDIADAESGIIKSRRAIAELRQRALARKGDYRKEVEMQMAQVGLEVDADAQKLKALTEELGRIQVRSPVSGQVVGLQFQTVGSVVQPGQKILDVVPINEGLLLETKIAPHLIDRVHTGQVADVRFSSFANSPLLAVEGRVESISNDLLTEPNMNPGQPGASYYLARVVITPEGLVKLGHHTLQPGMPVQIIIKTGERSLLTYLLHPFMKRISASLKEE